MGQTILNISGLEGNKIKTRDLGKIKLASSIYD